MDKREGINFGDVFICAGYFLGHLDGLGLRIENHAPRLATLLQRHSDVEGLIVHLRRVLHQLWLSEYGWRSIEVFAPIYDLICSMWRSMGWSSPGMGTSGGWSCVKTSMRHQKSRTH